MVCHILCPECAQDIGEVFPFFDAVRRGYFVCLANKKKTDIHVDKMDLHPDAVSNLDTNFCCRNHILGTADLDSIYT
jgi:hypothetical protein